MSEHTEHRGSRWRHFLLMLPFFLIGVAIPVYFYGFTGDGPPAAVSTSDQAPAPSAAPEDGSTPQAMSRRGERFGVVGLARRTFRDIAETYAPESPRLLVNIGLVVALFAIGFVVLRIVMAIVTGALGSFFGFLIHKAAGPMFMGFLAVGSTWGIHQTVAQEFGMQWAAATVAITAAVATLFALAGVRVRG